MSGTDPISADTWPAWVVDSARECVFETHKKTLKRREAPKWTRGRQFSQTSADRDADDHMEDAEPSRFSESNTGPDSSTLGMDPDNSGDGLSQGSSPALHPAELNSGESDAPLADSVMSTILVKPGDALDVLFEVARPQNKTASASGVQEPQIAPLTTPCISSPNTNLVAASGFVSVTVLSRPSDDVLDLWDKCRFVRQGWFTAQEAVTYLDLLHRHLAPLSPVLTDDLKDHKTHERLTRVVGSIESLILISDWHPQSVHFPPLTEGWDSELISPGYDRQNRIQTDEDVPLIRWREDVFEPAKRSERMSWMLLGAAASLAHELGVFADTAASTGPSTPSQHPHTIRSNRVRTLLYAHVTQMSMKMGCTSLLPDSASFASSPSIAGLENGSQDGSAQYIVLWTELTQLMKTAAALFFQSKTHTQQQVSTGQYSILLRHFNSSMTRWRDGLKASSAEISTALKSLLLIEYHYLKTCVNAIAIQAVVERAVARGVDRLSGKATEGMDACMLPHDKELIQEVVSGSVTVLEVAISMAAEKRLRYAPLRTLVCITSSSVYLLKAISLGARTADLQNSLQTLDKCIDALRRSGTDDMDFSVRYAALLEKHVAKFRRNFTLPQMPTHVTRCVNEQQNPRNAETFQSLLSNSQAEFTPFSVVGVSTRDDLEHFNAFETPQSLPNEWWMRPFDPNIAPFSTQGENISLGLELDSLDFLWNLPEIA
ncbi:Zn2-Cys6 binuclear cluster domain protein [Paramyrothecium foliicola]|nr:Zn2-Cys6 binuclear cluster domain protein [Paramyrothecium foliicola]